MSKPDPLKALLEIGELVRTQDNAGTHNPMFCVQVRKRMYGMDPTYCSEPVWIDTEDGAREIDKPIGEEQEKEYEENEFYQETGYFDYWETVAVAFTRSGCEDHLRLNGHNYRHYEETRIYVESWHRNPEMVAVYDFLRKLPAPVPSTGLPTVDDGLAGHDQLVVIAAPAEHGRHWILTQKMILEAFPLSRPLDDDLEAVIQTLGRRVENLHATAIEILGLANQLACWKVEAMQVLCQIDTCKVGNLLQLPLGSDVTPAIMPALERLLPGSAIADDLKPETYYWAYHNPDDTDPLIVRTNRIVEGPGKTLGLHEVGTDELLDWHQYAQWIFVPVPAPTLRIPKK